MTDIEIRAMTPADVEATNAMYLAGGWGERREMFHWVLANPATHVLVGIVDGAVVATGMATINGPVGWIGSIFVDREKRGRGYGRALTEAVCELIDQAGCRTQILIASEYGKPLYDHMGFRVEEQYQILEAATLSVAPNPPAGRTLRPMRPDDLERVYALDRRATAEDRSALIGSLLHAGWVLESGDELRGFRVSIHADSGALIALDLADAACLLDQRRFEARGRAETVRAAVPFSHEAGRLGLERLGWRPAFRTPRMLRGPAIDWDPTLIWGVLSFGFG